MKRRYVVVDDGNETRTMLIRDRCSTDTRTDYPVTVWHNPRLARLICRLLNESEGKDGQ